MFGQSIEWDSAGDLLHAVRTGQAAATNVFPRRRGLGLPRRPPCRGRGVRRSDGRQASVQIADILAAYDFSDRRRIVDIGGGEGHRGLFWPDDRRWFAATDVDSWSVYVGGDDAFTGQLAVSVPTECEFVELDRSLKSKD